LRSLLEGRKVVDGMKWMGKGMREMRVLYIYDICVCVCG
jgi:hypothetical protein